VALHAEAEGRRIGVGGMGPWHAVDGRWGVSGQCMARQEEGWGPGRQQMHGRDGGERRSGRQGIGTQGLAGGRASTWAAATVGSAQ
jgi:hypothetical protein